MPDVGGPPAARLSDLCVCPKCHGSLTWAQATITCSACAQTYRCEDGIPIFLDFDQTSTDEAVRYKLDQAEFFDGEAAEWEITRPAGAAAFYGWLMADKFRRSVSGLEPLLPGATVLTVCGGSGMDAEFLAHAGANVIASDISLGAAQRVRERSRRHGVTISPMVADVEQLPFADRSLDITYVHDGLHHLSDPANGLSEMLRVAKQAISMTEPVRATATRVAVCAGIALAREEAGNRVERIDPEHLAEYIRAREFRVVGSERYMMFYRHEPGASMRMLSRRRLLPVAAALLGLANRIAGRVGNKGTLKAVRHVMTDPTVPPSSSVRAIPTHGQTHRAG